ncbi:MAG TPA: MerR family transcriptional regulator [Gaiellaceae bacterium]|jgi:DNA-binding transcriptional MerR regulator|nr:MerR family transcriptional regulator [Gaiellaceae bacterium]
MTASAGVLRIGDLAERAGVTPRTIRYYEELGLLPPHEREQGKHRTYDEAAVERLREITRLRDLLGLSLEELKRVVQAEDARAELRRRFEETESTVERLRIVEQALPNVELQLELVRRRQDELRDLEADLVDRRKRLLRRRRELGADPTS